MATDEPPLQQAGALFFLDPVAISLQPTQLSQQNAAAAATSQGQQQDSSSTWQHVHLGLPGDLAALLLPQSGGSSHASLRVMVHAGKEQLLDHSWTADVVLRGAGQLTLQLETEQLRPPVVHVMILSEQQGMGAATSWQVLDRLPLLVLDQVAAAEMQALFRLIQQQSGGDAAAAFQEHFLPLALDMACALGAPAHAAGIQQPASVVRRALLMFLADQHIPMPGCLQLLQEADQRQPLQWPPWAPTLVPRVPVGHEASILQEEQLAQHSEHQTQQQQQQQQQQRQQSGDGAALWEHHVQRDQHSSDSAGNTGSNADLLMLLLPSPLLASSSTAQGALSQGLATSPAASSMPSKAAEPTPEAAAVAAPVTTTALQQSEQQQQLPFAVGPTAITLHQAVFGFTEAALEHHFGEFKSRHMQGIDSVMVVIKVLKDALVLRKTALVMASQPGNGPSVILLLPYMIAGYVPYLLLLCSVVTRRHREGVLAATAAMTAVVAMCTPTAQLTQQLVEMPGAGKMNLRLWLLVLWLYGVVPSLRQLTVRSHVLTCPATMVHRGAVLWPMVRSSALPVLCAVMLLCCELAAAIITMLFDWRKRGDFMQLVQRHQRRQQQQG